tara:strand:+ start:5311 stop:6255 length:945 start_codon:yes stop_codon:yes gene_type:complete
MNKDSKIYIAGHNGLVGSAVVRRLKEDGFLNIVTIDRKDLDLRNQQAVNMFFAITKPEYVIIAAGIVGGIVANNTRRAEFIYDNLMIQTNVVHAAYLHRATKLLALGSSCIYPRYSEQPISENRLLTGELEPTNEPYAISKIASIKTCDAYRHQYGCNFISAMPTNLYGIGDHYDPLQSHVLPALIRKFIVAKRDNTDVTMWGTGTPRREFMYVDDMADACLFLMKNYNESGHINVGTGVDIELKELTKTIAEIVGFKGEILHDLTYPDGMGKKLLDVSKINAMGWGAKTTLKEGLEKIIADIYKTNKHLEWLK